MKRIKIFMVTCILIILMMSNSFSTSVASAQNLPDIESFIDEFLQKKIEENKIPNLAITVVADGEIVFEKGYGFANIDEQTIVDPNSTLFRIGSVSKLFTWTAIMQLVEEGKLDLYTDINEYLDFEIPASLAVGPDKDEPKPITLFHLMTHTPGFEDTPNSIIRLNDGELPPLHEYVKVYLPERIFPPGEVIAYSNYGTALAGYIVELVSGMPFESYVEENIFQPLGMNNSTFEQPLPNELSSNLTQAYRYINGEFKAGVFEYMPGAAGGMSSTAKDMANFMQAYLNGGSFNGEQILETNTVQQMFEQQFTHHPYLDGMTLGFMEMTLNGKRIVQHSGNTPFFDAGLYLIPDENIGLFISYSGNNFFTHTELFHAFMNHYFPNSNSTSVTPMTNQDVSQYTGEYHQNRKSLTNGDKIVSVIMGGLQVQVDKNGDLLVTNTQLKETHRFVQIDQGIFENTGEGPLRDAYGEFSTIVFQTDPHGNVMLTTDGPMSYSKVPWYGSSGFTFLPLILSLLTVIVSLLFWGIKAWKGKKRNITHPKPALFGKRLAVTTGIFFLVLIAGIAISGGLDPVYQLPKDALGTVPSWVSIFNVIPYLLTITGIAMLIFTVLLWWKKYWSVLGRLHYTLLTLLMMHLIWVFSYWNLY